MNNERRILPLRKYDVTVFSYARDEYVEDTFTATHHNTEEGVTRFYSDGNIIREYHSGINRIVISPIDEQEPV